MNANLGQLRNSLNDEGNIVSLVTKYGSLEVKRFDVYAAIGYLLESNGGVVFFRQETEDQSLYCACIPGSPCYPDCADS